MRNKAHIIGLAGGILIAPVLLGLGIFSGGAGHGDYLLAKIFFPVTMLSTLVFDTITLPFIMLAVVQYPLYGWFIGAGFRPEARPTGLWVILVLHGIALTLNLILPNPSFGR